MKVLFVLGGLRVGGYEILTVCLANELFKRGTAVSIVSFSLDRDILDRVSPGIDVHFVDRKFKFDVSVIFRLAALIRRKQPEIVYSCAYFEYGVSRVAGFFVGRKRPKYIMAFHVTRPSDKKEAQWNRIYSLSDRFFRDRHVAIHASQIDFYSGVYGIPQENITLIYNGIDTSYFSPPEKKEFIRDGIIRLVHVASLKPLKDQMTLLRAVARLEESLKDWRLTIAGADQGGMLKEYQEFVASHNIEEKVRFAGAVDDVREILENSDIFILTSLTEALPVSVIEAISMGLPAIVTNVGGNPEIISDGVEGYLVEPGDYVAIAERIRYLFENRAVLEDMCRNARKKAESHFSFQHMVTDYMELFESVAA